MTQSYRLQHLFQKYLRSECSEEELIELTQMLNEMEDDELDAPMKALWSQSKDKVNEHSVDWDRMLNEVRTTQSVVLSRLQVGCCAVSMTATSLNRR